ncbi:MAG: DUF2165 domain-containing protein [Pseudomonadota bacterium]
MNGGALAIRLSKIVMTGGIGFWAFLVVLGNITDYGSNWAFVQHVLAMDTIFPDSQLKWRAVTDPSLQKAAYLIIIAIEALTCLAFLAAATVMAIKLGSPKHEFQRARVPLAIGVSLGFGLWFIGFMAIGGEWFAMWQSKEWNGQNAAFKFYMTILVVVLYVFMDTDGDEHPTQ